MDRRAVGAGCALGVVAAALAVLAFTGQPESTPPPAPPMASGEASPPMLHVPPDLAEEDIQAMWDPREVGDLPRVEVPGLPPSLDPPAAAGPPTGWTRVMALLEEGPNLWLVDDHGTWARLTAPESPVDEWGGCASLTVDGSRILYTGRTGLWVHRLGAGRWERITYPPGFTRAPDWGPATTVSDTPSGTWLADRRGPQSWYLDLDDRTFTPFDEPLEVAASGPGGPLVRIGWHRGHRTISVGVPGAEEARWDGEPLDSLTSPATDGTSLVATRGVGGWSGNRGTTERNGLIAVRLDDLSVRAYLPVPDPNYWYTDAQQLAALTWLDDATVLASVLPQGAGGVRGARHLFTWNVETGELRWASTVPGDIWLSVAVYDSAANPSAT